MNDAKHTYTNRVDLAYLPTLGIKPVAGRVFAEQFADSSAFVLNETAVRLMGFPSASDAIGKKIYTEREGQRYDYTVVGVVKDFHFEDLKTPISPFGFQSNEGTNYNYVIAHAKAANMAKVLGSIEVAWQALNPSEPFEYSFLDEDFLKNYKAENRLATVVGYFTLMAVLISCLGLFGLAMFTAQRRMKEIGVRKVLGQAWLASLACCPKNSWHWSCCHWSSPPRWPIFSWINGCKISPTALIFNGRCSLWRALWQLRWRF